MRVLFLPVFFWTTFFCAAPAFANEKPQYAYQEGILQSSRHERSGNHCIESSNASESAGASTEGRGDETSAGFNSCNDDDSIAFTVESGGAIYILTPKGDCDPSKGGLVIRALIRHSVLENQPPQTHIELRSDGRHFFVKLGDRESMYSVARVQ
jgi:hypothetical protein